MIRRPPRPTRTATHFPYTTLVRSPTRPTDLDAQRDRINGLLAEATVAGAQVVVLPEPGVTEELAFELEAWVRRPGPVRLLVAGSFHHADPADPPRRANRALAVLAWSNQPRFVHPANLAEVTTVRSVPIGYPVARTGRARPVDDTDSGPAAPEPSVGVMTATVLELLAAHLGLAGPVPEESGAGSR